MINWWLIENWLMIGVGVCLPLPTSNEALFVVCADDPLIIINKVIVIQFLFELHCIALHYNIIIIIILFDMTLIFTDSNTTFIKLIN